LFELLAQAEPLLESNSQAIRQLMTALTLSKTIAQVQAGENLDEALRLIEAELKQLPDSLMAYLARTSILIKQGVLSKQEAAEQLKRDHQLEIARALDGCIWDTQSESVFESGMAAFLIQNKAGLQDLSMTLEMLKEQAIEQHDRALLAEMVLCDTVAQIDGETSAFSQDGYRTSIDTLVAGWLSEYLLLSITQPQVAASIVPEQIAHTLESKLT
jgi:hypothetical protein